MNSTIKTINFKNLPIEVEVKDLHFVQESPHLLGQPHKANFYQIIWITEGELTVWVDFREIKISANQLFIISSGQVCQFHTAASFGGKMVLFTSNFFAITELDANFLHTAEVLNPVSLNKSVSICPEFIGSIVSLIEEELKKPTDSYQIGIAQNLIRIVLFEIERMLSLNGTPKLNSVARSFVNAVELSFHENRSTEYYVTLLGINEKLLAKEVKAITGKTPKVYIDSRIVLEAKRLLSYSNLSIKEIGYALGFDEPTNFNKFFRKHTAQTPIQFREVTSPK